MIADTTFAIDLMRKEQKAIDKLNELTRRGEIVLFTTLTIFELFSGIKQCKKPEHEKEKVRSVLKEQLLIHFDEDAAEKAGEIDGTLIKEGIMIQPIDSMIAGITLTKSEKILTRNIKHFQRVQGLKVETY